MGFYPLFPVNRECLETHDAPDWTKPENIVTNGPYTIEFRRPRDRIRLVKNPHYWNRDNIVLETIDVLSIEDQTTSLNMYMRGDVDWIVEPPNNVMRDFMRADPPRNDFNPAPMSGTYYYKFNTSRGELADKRVRQALSLAIDREEIIRTAVRGPQGPALHLVPPGMPGYTSPNFPDRDPERARQLLAEAGFKDGHGFRPIEIIYNTHESHAAVAEIVAMQWQKELGITVRLKNAAWPAYQDALRLKQYDVGRQAWIADYIDPNSFIDLFVSDNENNQTGWANARYDELVEQAEGEFDPQKRLTLLAEAEAILADEVPVMPIYFYYSKHVVHPRVRNFFNNLQDQHPLHAIWIDENPTEPNEFMKGASR
jgi:oligopeptide transport system substrate-binding protein